ncbi:unnamed protein product [Diamesa hyperborea]
MDSSSLLDRVILYSLKNTMPDNKRLDAAKNKIINGNLNSFNSNSSDSNSSNKSIIEDSKPRSAVDKIIEEFKGNSSSNSSSGGSGNGNGSAKGLITGANTLRDSSKSPEAVKSVETSKPVILVVEDLKLASDISNGADNSKSNCNLVNEVKQIEPNVISTTLVAVEPTIKRSETPAYVVTPTNIQQVKEISSNPDLKIRQSPVGYSNEALDFREMKPEVPQQPETMLDLSIPNKSYDDKKVPIIKRNHALYVGLPDFSKQIFSEPTVSRADPAMGSLKVPNPDFSTMQRAPELQMRHPDFTKSFNESAATSSSSVSVTPSNFVEIARKNNYISDLQLKTPAAASPSSSYKIDFRPTSKLEVTTKTGTPSISPYPNMKKEGISAYNQQQNQLSDEPMAHIINKSHFLPVTREEKTEYQKPPQVPAPIIPSGHQYSSSSSGSTYYPQVPEKKPAKNPHDNYPGLPPGPTAPNHTPSAFYMHGPQEDLRKYNPAHYPYKDSGTYSRIVENLERQEQHEFSLKQKEQLLRQEGTIITIKNEPPTPPAPIASQSKPVSSSTSSRESYGSHSADLYRDMKLKQMNHEYTHPKESLPNVQHQTARRVSDPIPYHQQYPDFPGTNQQYSKNYRYEPLKGAFKMVEQQNKSPAPSLVYPHPDAIRHSQQIKQTTSPGMHAQGQPITKQENFYGSSGSSKSYGSPSPVHLVKSPHSLPPTPALMKSIDGQMNPPQNWPPPGATIRLSSNPPGQPMSSPSPTKYLHQSQPKMSSSPLHQIKQSPSPHQAYPGYQPQGKYTQSYPPVKGMEAKDQDLRHSNSDQNLNQYQLQQQQQQQQQQQHQRAMMQEAELRNREVRYHANDSQSSRYQEHPTRGPTDPPRMYSQQQQPSASRLEHIPAEISVVSKVKVEPKVSLSPAIPVQRELTSTSVIKTFVEVKKESPLDLSVKTIKTKADSTGDDYGAVASTSRRQRPEPSGLKVEFTPNFATARIEYIPRPEVPQNYGRPPSPQMQVPVRDNPSSSRPYMYPGQQLPPPTQRYHDMERPHAPLPSVSNPQINHYERPIYPIEMKTDAMIPEMHRAPGHNYEHPMVQKIEEARTSNNHHQQPFYPPNHKPAQNYNIPGPAAAAYPVINKPQHSGSPVPTPEMEKRELQKLRTQKSIEISEDDNQSNQKQDLSPRQFRTKAELKGFNAADYPATVATVEPTVDNKIKLPEPERPAAPSAFDLMDWGSACNDFVEQLQTGKKRAKKKRTGKKGDDAKLEVVDKPVPLSDIPGTTTNDLSEVPIDIVKSINNELKPEVNGETSSDEDKPLLHLLNPQMLRNVIISRTALVEKISEKISRNMREKQRLEQEQKLIARLGKPSSSESESEARRPVRTLKRVRRLRKRAALGMRKTSDEEEEEEEEEATDDDKKLVNKRQKTGTGMESSDSEEAVVKRKISRNISKLEEMTSSEEDSPMKKSKDDQKTSDKKSSTDQKQQKDEKCEKSPGKKSCNSKLSESKKQISSSESEESDDDGKNNKDKKSKSPAASSSSAKLKKLKSLRDGMLGAKTLLKEEETMTRSKRKLENEKKFANSKVLRNEKVVHNIAPDKKVTKSAEPIPSSTSTLCRKSKRKDSTKLDDVKRKILDTDSDDTAGKLKKKSTKFAPGWEQDTYNFKRSLKVPAGLITLSRPPLHGISHSLPDLDQQSSDTSEIFSDFVRAKDLEKKAIEAKKTEELPAKGKKKTLKDEKVDEQQKKPGSMIELLHQRVVQSKKRFKTKKAAGILPSSLTKSHPEKSDDETLDKESDKVLGLKKNIFETSVIKSRTRTENKAIRSKEIIREVFGSEDRPASAPPLGLEQISFDQKYREYLDKMNVGLPEKLVSKMPVKLESKHEDDDDDDDEEEDNENVINDKESSFGDTLTLPASERDLVTPLPLKIKKKGRGIRTGKRKGSSGFDYIRKKKKPPAHNAADNPLSVNNIIKKRLAAMENLENKDETDISKEIKGWVLNKGVGESVLHKASRLGYVDVIAYCLERINMSPDPKDNAGYTPLHEACSKGHLDIARLLLQFGANHSETAQSGIRPLHEAVENGYIEIVRLLLSYGADPCLATYSGQTPIMLSENENMTQFLRSYLIDVDNIPGTKVNWKFDESFSVYDPDELGYEIFEDIPVKKISFGSSMVSVLSTSTTSLITATTQMSDNETITSETMSTPIKVPVTPAKMNFETKIPTPIQPAQDLMKFQHKMKKCDTNSNNIVMANPLEDKMNNNSQDVKKVTKKGANTKSCSVVMNNIDSLKKIKKLPAISKQESPPVVVKIQEPIRKLEEIKHKDDYDDMVDENHLESDNELLEIEESEAPLPPLYLLKDEGSEKWILLTDLCNLLKVKSKDAVLKQICPSSPPAMNKELLRELKMSDFLEKAICLQLFCAGEKLNIRSSKVILVRYNDSVRNLLGVSTIRMNM